ncbi:MAG: RES family NAD+ phosphorylase [Candidatus Sumerlaeaceae bacterium]|nr:RES family NAD+ phosphorylase [Candidatus Sumerlaeaceae bacterium]
MRQSPRQPDLLDLLDGMRSLFEKRLVGPFEGLVFRSVSKDYAKDPDLLSGNGAFEHAGRWNPKGVFRAVHGSESPELALSEALAVGRRSGFPDEQQLPRVTRAIRVRLSRVLDLRHPAVLRELKVTIRQLKSHTWWQSPKAGQEALTQSIGRAASETGFEGIIVPSAVSKSEFNLIVFPSNLSARSRMEIGDSGY